MLDRALPDLSGSRSRQLQKHRRTCQNCVSHQLQPAFTSARECWDEHDRLGVQLHPELGGPFPARQRSSTRLCTTSISIAVRVHGRSHVHFGHEKLCVEARRHCRCPNDASCPKIFESRRKLTATTPASHCAHDQLQAGTAEAFESARRDPRSAARLVSQHQHQQPLCTRVQPLCTRVPTSIRLCKKRFIPMRRHR